MKRGCKLFHGVLAAVLLAALCVPSVSAHTHSTGDASQAVISDWAKEEVARAEALGLIPQDLFGWPTDYRQPISRNNFQQVAMRFVARQTNCDYDSLIALVDEYLAEKDEGGLVVSPFTDGGIGASEAYYLGVVKGRGDGTFDPDGLITRQEAAVMLSQTYTAYSGQVPGGLAEPNYPDGSQMDAWARNGVAAVTTWGVMKGMEDGSFSPKSSYTTEQCLITFLRLYENAPVTRAKGNVEPLFSYDQCIQLLEGQTKTTKEKDFGYAEVDRAEGEKATFVRMDLTSPRGSSSIPYFVYQDGGMKRVDLGLCLYANQLDVTQVTSHCRFNESGDVFTCTVTLPQDTVFLVQDQEMVYHEKGVYSVTVNVDTLEYQTVRTADAAE